TNVGKVDLKAKSLQEKNTAKYIAPFAKVADDRGGAIGWKLTAKLTDGKIKTIEGNELPGAELKVQLGRFLGKDIPVQSVPAIPANFNSDVTDNLTVLNGADVNIVSANAGAGQGETVVSFGERLEDEKETDRVQLAIADTNQILAGKKYTGKIVWTLNDTPA
ncbi:MAG: WxL domain-containing protein, partial [Streptococcaceae bacterium]|nr:WxL domain-containing protein [Streptococcaceae bacterium]